jgi:sterol O-acyltransferase
MTNLIGYTLFKDFLVPQSMLLDDLVTCLIRCLFLGFLQLYLAHTCTMHAWMNMSAELTGFADRNFYQDWWNSQSLGEYLGKWNPVILEWLKSYFYAYLKSWAPRAVALLAILLLSAAEHDFLIGTGLGFFIPMYLVEYGLIGFLLSFKPSLGKQTDRLIMCVGLSLGTGILMTIYLTELVARSQCGASSSWFEGMWALECYRRFNN